MTGSANLKENRKNSTHLWIFGLGLATALIYVFIGFRAQPFVDHRPDPYYFAAMGRSLAHGEGFDKYGILIKRRAPFYPFFISLIYRIFGDHAIYLQFAQSLLFAATCLITYLIGCRLFSYRTGLIAGVLCALNPVLLRYVPDFHLEILFTFLVTLMLLMTVHYYEKSTISNALKLGVAAGFTALTKAVFVIYPLIFLIYWFLRKRSARVGASGSSTANLVPALLVFVSMGIVIVPWSIRNYRVTGGHLVLISSGFSDAFLRGYVFSKPEYATLKLPPYTYAENESNNYFRRLCVEQGTIWEKNDLETDKILNQEAKRRFLANPLEFVKKFITGLFTFWYEMTSKINSLFAGLAALILWIFAWMGIVRAKNLGKDFWLLLMPILYLNILLAALLALGRYSVPILPALMVLSAYGIESKFASPGSA